MNWKIEEDRCVKVPARWPRLNVNSLLDGAHTLTCALMLLNTDLHGHVSRGAGGREPGAPRPGPQGLGGEGLPKLRGLCALH